MGKRKKEMWKEKACKNHFYNFIAKLDRQIEFLNDGSNPIKIEHSNFDSEYISYIEKIEKDKKIIKEICSLLDKGYKIKGNQLFNKSNVFIGKLPKSYLKAMGE